MNKIVLVCLLLSLVLVSGCAGAPANTGEPTAPALTSEPATTAKPTPTPSPLTVTLPFTDTAALGPYDKAAIDNLHSTASQVSGKSNPPVNIGGEYNGPLIYLDATQPIIITVESDNPAVWDASGQYQPLGRDGVVFFLGWVNDIAVPYDIQFDSQPEFSIENNGSYKVTVTFTPERAGYFGIRMINDSDRSHYGKYVIEYASTSNT